VSLELKSPISPPVEIFRSNSPAKVRIFTRVRMERPAAATQSFVLIADDPDAPWDLVHGIFDLPANLRALPQISETHIG